MLRDQKRVPAYKLRRQLRERAARQRETRDATLRAIADIKETARRMRQLSAGAVTFSELWDMYRPPRGAEGAPTVPADQQQEVRNAA